MKMMPTLIFDLLNCVLFHAKLFFSILHTDDLNMLFSYEFMDHKLWYF